MLNRKQRRIEALERQAAQAGPYLEIAQEIRKRIGELAINSNDMDANYAQAVAEMESKKRLQTVQAIFDQLPPETQLEKLAALFGDQEIKDALESRRQKVLEDLHRQQIYGDLESDAKQHRKIDITTIPENTMIRIGLFPDTLKERALKNGSKSGYCPRSLTLHSLGEGRFHVIEDLYNPDSWAPMSHHYQKETWEKTALQNHTVISFGILVEEAGVQKFNQTLFFGTEVVLRHGDEPAIPTELNLGFVLIDASDRQLDLH